MKQEEKKAIEKKYKEYNERLDKLLEKVIIQAHECKIPISKNINPKIYINLRAKKRFGACRLIKDHGKKFFIIEISYNLYNSDDKTIMEVIAHEVLHTCNGAMNHGEKWKRYAFIMNKTYGYNIKRVSTREEMNLSEEKIDKLYNVKYIVKCLKCGKEIYRLRKSKVVMHPEKYRCQCGGKLQIYVIKNNH